MTKNAYWIILYLFCFTLDGCFINAGESPQKTATNDTNDTIHAISINDTSTIPIVSNKPVILYVHNNTNALVSGIDFHTEYHLNNKIYEEKIPQCYDIPAYGRCELMIKLPTLPDSDLEGSFLLSAKYGNDSVSRIINFMKVQDTDLGVFFGNTHPFIANQNITLYAYGGLKQNYVINNIKGTNIHDATLYRDQVFPIELKPSASTELIVDAMHDSIKYETQQHVNATPSANGAVLIVGIAPTINTDSTTSGSIFVMNAGNVATNTNSINYTLPANVTMGTGANACTQNNTLNSQASCTLYFTVCIHVKLATH